MMPVLFALSKREEQKQDRVSYTKIFTRGGGSGETKLGDRHGGASRIESLSGVDSITMSISMFC